MSTYTTEAHILCFNEGLYWVVLTPSLAASSNTELLLAVGTANTTVARILTPLYYISFATGVVYYLRSR